jgi:large subunit ribosomal protein L4
MDIPVYSVAGQVVDHVTVDTAALGGKPNMALLRQALLMYEANKRVGTAKVKTRSTISGSGAKPWRQKHTGRARHGTRYSPIWVGGAVAHGPQPRDYRQRMPRAARRKALSSAFLAKAADGEVLAVDALELPEAKTKAMAGLLRNLGVRRTCLIVLSEHDAELWRCTRNIPGAAMLTYGELNAYDMIRPQRVVFARPALEQFLSQQAGKTAGSDAAPEQVGV